MIKSIVMMVLCTTYYVSPSGDDAANGVSSAWRTIDRVNQAPLADADVIAFEGGATFDGILSVRHGLLVTSYGNARATIRGKIEVVDTGNVELSQLNVIGLPDQDGIEILNTNDGDHKYEWIFLHHLDVSGAGHAGIYLRGAGSATAGFRNVWLIRVDCHHNRYAGFWTGGGYSPDSSLYSHENVYAGWCRFYANSGVSGYGSGEGVMFCQVNGGWIEWCEAFENGAGCDTPNGPVGIWCVWSRNVTFHYNISHHNRTGGGDGGGFDIDGGCSDCVMEGNWSYDNQGPGFEICQFDDYRACANNVFRNNVSQRDEVGFRIWANRPLDGGNQVDGNRFEDERTFDYFGSVSAANVAFFDNDPQIGF